MNPSSADLLEYDVVDVFAERPFSGNQLAVVHGTEGLSDDQLLALAREFGYSETTFPGPVERGPAGEQRYPVRIFTPGGELPFAGHPTLGTAWVLEDLGLLGGDEAVQVCGAGDVPVRLGGTPELTVTPHDLAGPLPDDVVERLLDDLGLRPEDRDGEVWVAGAGISFVHLPVHADAIPRAGAPRGLPREVVGGLDLADPLVGLNLVATAGLPDVRARVFVPDVAVAEDPATGAAAAGLGLALVAAGLLPEGGDYEIVQGVELGRPSRLTCRVEATAGRAERCHVAGRVFRTASGRVAVPPE